MADRAARGLRRGYLPLCYSGSWGAARHRHATVELLTSSKRNVIVRLQCRRRLKGGMLTMPINRIKNRLVPEQESYELFWDIVIRSAQQLQRHLDDQTAKRGYEYAPDYQWLARRFKCRWLRERGRLPSAYKRMSLAALLAIEPLPVWSSAAAVAAKP
jgi:hypothetical protein